MNLRTGIVLATLALVPLSACSGAAAASSAAPAPASSSAAAPASSSSPASAASSAGTSSSAASTSYTMAEVAKHNSQADCWAAIDGNVYDLTKWVSRHAGGPDKIIPLCGTDATSAFHNQHDDQARPNNQLATFKVGTLAG
jgi:cytochrome b involved in lipid metabolism